MMKHVTFRSPRVLSVLVAALLVLVFPLLFQDRYVIRLATLCVMYMGLASSLNLVTGFMGQVSLGHAAFLGIGAYTSAILSERLEWPFLVTALCATLMAAVFGMLLGMPTLTLSGSYLSIVSLGFCEIVRIVETNWIELTNGPMGINGIARPNLFGLEIKSEASYYYLILVMTALIILILSNIIRSHVGRAVLSIREDPIASEAMGVPVFRYKVMVFTLSSAFAGLIGAFYAHYMRYIDATAFNFDQSITILSMVILGGSGSLPGSILGALILTLIPELFRFLADYRLLFYGLVLVIMIIFRPKGLLGRTTFAQLLGCEPKYAITEKERGIKDEQRQ